MLENKILVTGITSSIGNYTINWMKRNYPNRKILGVGRNREKLSSLETQYDIEVLSLDFGNTDDVVEKAALLASEKIDTIFHLSTTSPSNTIKKTDFYKINFINPRHLFEEIYRESTPRFLNFSSASVYSSDSEHLHEKSALNTSCDYGMSKYLFEKFLDKYQKSTSLISVRIPVLLAPNVKHNFVSKWWQQIKCGNRVKIFNPEGDFNSCVWLGDVLNFAKLFFDENRNEHLVCNVGASAPLSIRESLNVLLEHQNRDLEVESVVNGRLAQFYDSTLAIRNGFVSKPVRDCLLEYAEYSSREN